jgi:flavin reductase (DIM6/NTAB) family NADH-FMN oxidoreductase RutF
MKSSITPPMLAISVGLTRYTHSLIQKSKQFVLAWPGEDLAEETILCGTKSGKDIDKFGETGLTLQKAEYVKIPLIKECVANVECRLAGSAKCGDHTIFMGEILNVWLNEKPKRLLCSVDDSSGYDFILEKSGYRFGAVKI